MAWHCLRLSWVQKFESAEPGGTAPAPQTYDLVLQAVGRTPNGKKISADKAGVAVTDRGFINVDIQMRTNVPHIFAIGDIVGQPMLAHKAVHEAHVAAEVIAGELLGNKELASSAFNARVIPSVAYTDPEVAWVGLTEDQAKAQGIKVKKGLFPWTASGHAIANGRDEGVTKLLSVVRHGPAWRLVFLPVGCWQSVAISCLSYKRLAVGGAARVQTTQTNSAWTL